MKKYIVLLEPVERGTDEIGYCDPTIMELFNTEEEARQYYDSIDIAEEYYCDSGKENTYSYLEASLGSVEFIYDEEDKKWRDKGEGIDFLETKTAGKYFGNDDKMLYLVETANGKREFWTVENCKGVITLRYMRSNTAKNCDGVYSDINWCERRLSDKEFDELFADVKIIDSKCFR